MSPAEIKNSPSAMRALAGMREFCIPVRITQSETEAKRSVELLSDPEQALREADCVRALSPEWEARGVKFLRN